jgi:hypothetical protein
MAKGLTKSEWRRLLDRDRYCLHCGETEQIAPQHRRNRGMGGSSDPETNSSSNLMILCSSMNGRIEISADAAETARLAGWKLRPWQSTSAPVLDRVTGEWWVLTDDFTRRPFDPLTDE